MCGTVSTITRGVVDAATLGTAELGGISKKVGNTVGGMVGENSASVPGAPNYGQYPGLTQEEQDALKKQNISLDQLNGIINGDQQTIANNKNVLQGISGLYNSDGTINQAALDDLKSRTQNHIDLSNQVGDQALGYLKNYFSPGGAGGAPSDQQTSINNAENQQYLDALNGKYQASVGLQQNSSNQFNLLKEAAAKRGIRIDGDSFDTATSESTAGIRMISEFQKNYNAQVDAEKQSILSRGGSQNIARTGQAQTAGAQNFTLANSVAAGGTPEQLGYFTSGNQTTADQLSPVIGQYIAGQGVASAPFSTQRANVFNAGVNQGNVTYSAANNAYTAQQQQQAGFGQLLGTGIGAFVGGPWGAAVGSKMGSGTSSTGSVPQSLSLYNNNQAGLARYYASGG